MCRQYVIRQRADLYVTLSYIIAALTLATIALIANLSFWTAATAVVLMAFAVAFCSFAASQIWALNGKLDLMKCLDRTKAPSACIDLYDKIRSTTITLRLLLVLCAIITAVAAALAWLPYWGAIPISIAITMILVCLTLIIYVINMYNNLLACIS